MSGKGFSRLFSDAPPAKQITEIEDLPLADEETPEDVGPCAAIAKNKWVTALTIQHATQPWESYQYSGFATRSVYDPRGSFWVRFVDDDATWRITVTGRNLLRIYNLIVQRRMEWLRAADRDFAPDGEQIITGIRIEKEAEGKEAKS